MSSVRAPRFAILSETVALFMEVRASDTRRSDNEVTGGGWHTIGGSSGMLSERSKSARVTEDADDDDDVLL